MCKRQTSDSFRFGRHIRNLERHSDRERVIGKIQVIRMSIVRKIQSAGMPGIFLIFITVIQMRVTESK